MFSIDLLPEGERTSYGDRLGQIRVGQFSERIVVAALPGQDVSALPTEWRRNLRELLERVDAVALRTQPHEVWVLYRCDSAVFVQNQMLVPDWPGSLSVEGAVVSVPGRQTVTEDGDPISEWATSVADVRDFLDQFESPA